MKQDEYKVSPDMLLMMEDTVVMRINFDLGKYDVITGKLLPWAIKGRIKDSRQFDGMSDSYSQTQRTICNNTNYSTIISWLANRTLPLSRRNAKWLYNMLKVEQVQSDSNRVKISLMCRAVSLQDNYWVKSVSDSVVWSDVNVRTNKLNDVVTQVALHGTSLALQGSLTSPEFTGQGAYPKAWKREDGYLWLYKMGGVDPTDSKIEVMCSKILDKCNVVHLEYLAGESEGIYCCKCKCMSTENISILPGMDYYSYCCVNEIPFDESIIEIDADSIYKMWIVDYIISNRDRHGLNWGFFYDNKTMEIIGCHPLYDHNNAFNKDYMNDPDANYQFGSMTVRQAARYAMARVDFHFTSPIERSDFMTTRQYNSFTERAKELGIKTIPISSVNSALDKLSNI